MRPATSFLLLLLLLAGVPSANAQIFLRLEGALRGPIDGDIVYGPLTGTIETTSFALSVNTPIDQATGLPAGPAQASPLTLSKGTDSSTIGIIAALATNESLNRCSLEAHRPDGLGGTIAFLRLTLSGARIESWGASADASGIVFESISIAYDTVEWRDFDTGDTYTYRMGSTSVVGLPETELGLAAAPNPTKGQTMFAFRLPQSGSVSIEVYDIRGRHVATVFDGEVGVDEGIITWDGRDAAGRPVSSGTYLAKMRAGDWLTTRKMAVVR